MPTVPTAQIFDVGKSVRDVLEATALAKPPRVAPAQLLPVLTYMDTVTNAVVARVQSLQQQSLSETNRLELEKLIADLDPWRLRLSLYGAQVQSCIAQGRGLDAQCCLWSVTAPLLFGIYDGPSGKTNPGTPDMRRPFVFANTANEIQKFESSEWAEGVRILGEQTAAVTGAIVEGVTATVEELAKIAGKGVAAAAGGLGWLTLLVAGGVVGLIYLRNRD